MQVRDLATVFKLTVVDLSKISGYTRQGLYQLFERKYKNHKPRFDEFLVHMELVNQKLYEKDMAQALLEKNIRENTLNELRKEMKQ